MDLNIANIKYLDNIPLSLRHPLQQTRNFMTKKFLKISRRKKFLDWVIKLDGKNSEKC